MRTWQVRKQQGQGPSGGQWFCFDDNTVEPWDISKLDAECYGGKESESRAAQGLPPSPRPLGVSLALWFLCSGKGAPRSHYCTCLDAMHPLSQLEGNLAGAAAFPALQAIVPCLALAKAGLATLGCE